MFAPPFDRNAPARSFLARYTLCNVCIATETDVHVRFCTEPEERSERGWLAAERGESLFAGTDLSHSFTGT
jgi:hypothetical protein